MAAVAEKTAATLAAKEIVGALIARALVAQRVYEG